MIRNAQWATCYTRHHGSTTAVRLVMDGNDIWKKYLPHQEAGRQADALERKLAADGWVAVVDPTCRVAG